MRVLLVNTEPFYWHNYMVGETLDVKQSVHIPNAYELLATEHNEQLLTRYALVHLIPTLGNGMRILSKRFTKIVPPASNQEAIQYLHE